jgi:hypothetical protein
MECICMEYIFILSTHYIQVTENLNPGAMLCFKYTWWIKAHKICKLLAFFAQNYSYLAEKCQ